MAIKVAIKDNSHSIAASIHIVIILLGLLLFVPLARGAGTPETAPQPAPQRSLLVLSKADHTLAIVDPVTLQVIARLPVGPDPHEVVASSDGRMAYVSNTGSGRFHELDVLDLIARKALPSVDTGALIGPHGLAFVGGEVWFTAEGAKAVARYDPRSAKIDWILGTGQNRTHMIYVTEDQKHVYATNVDSGTVSILENVLMPPTVTPMGTVLPGAKPSMQWMQTVVPVSEGSEGFDISPDGRELWTAAAGDGVISIIDTAAKKVAATLDAKVLGANRLKFTPDGKRVLISSARSGDLSVYDAAMRKEVIRLSLGHGAAGILIDAKSEHAFVACTPDNYVAVVDLKTLKVTSHLDAGGRPDGLAWAIAASARATGGQAA